MVPLKHKCTFQSWNLLYKNKIIWDFKMTSKEPEYRLMRFRGVEVQLYRMLQLPSCPRTSTISLTTVTVLHYCTQFYRNDHLSLYKNKQNTYILYVMKHGSNCLEFVMVCQHTRTPTWEVIQIFTLPTLFLYTMRYGFFISFETA